MMDWAAKNALLRALRYQRASIKQGKKPTQKELLEVGLQARHLLLKEAQLKGTTVHTWAEDFYNTGKVPELLKGYEGYWKSFEKFNTYFNLKPILQETVLYSHEFAFAGRMDFYGILKVGEIEKRVLVDFKTSNMLHWSYGLQLAAYKHCLEQMGYPVDECYILHLRSHGFYEFVEFKEPFELFLKARDLFDAKATFEHPEFELAVEPKEFIQKLKTPTE